MVTLDLSQKKEKMYNSALGRQTYDEPVFTGIQGLYKLDFHPLYLIQTVSSLILTPNSVASVVGHGFLSRHLIAPHWDFPLFQYVKELLSSDCHRYAITLSSL